MQSQKDPNENIEMTNEQKQAIFDERFNELTNGFGEACEKHGIKTAIAIAIHPQEEQPIVFVRGHHYDVGVVLAAILRNIKEELISGLDTDTEINYSNH